MRFVRGMGCDGPTDCSCRVARGMAQGPPGMPIGYPSDAPFGAFDTTLSTITFPSLPAMSPSSLSAATGLSIIPATDGTYSVVLGTQTLASGISRDQAQSVVEQNASGAAVLSANPVAANVLSGNPLQPSIVGTDDGSGMIQPTPVPPSPMCNLASSLNANPILVLAGVAALAFLLRGKK